MTSYALTHSQSFKIGIAGGTVSDWRNYDSIYTERYMGTPQNNPEGYRKSSPVTSAKNLHGKLLLIHGAIDDNVHMANTIQFVYELQKAGKQFELMLYPKSRHGVTDPTLLTHMRQMMTDFIVRNL
jgi:dipeptidyl-peptidase-4